MTDQYATEQETAELVKPDSRTPAQKYIDNVLESRGAFEQGAEPYPMLYKLACEIINDMVGAETQMAELEQEARLMRARMERLEKEGSTNALRMVRDACKPYGKAGECVYTTFKAMQEKAARGGA